MGRRYGLAVLAVAMIVQGCGEEPAVPVTNFGAPWTTEPEFEFGDSGGGSGAGFGFISAVRVLGDGDRILVAEAASRRATLWTPDGSLIREVGGPGEGPGEFAGQFVVQVRREGFLAIDDLGRRFTSFSDGGTFVETIPFPPNPPGGPALGYAALLDDGSVFATPKFSALDMLGFDDNPPIESLPVVLLSEEDGRWGIDTVAVLDTRNRALVIRLEGTPAFGGIQSEQVFGDHDLVWFDPVAGRVTVVRRNLGDGVIELAEIDAAGDTAWRRRISPPPVELTPDQVAGTVDAFARALSGSGERTLATMRAAVREALFVPDVLPGVSRMRGTASGEIWLNGFETGESHNVWYAVHRNDAPAGVRRILLPSGFTVMDATDARVWGYRRDDLGVQYVVGLRLLPPSISDETREVER